MFLNEFLLIKNSDLEFQIMKSLCLCLCFVFELVYAIPKPIPQVTIVQMTVMTVKYESFYCF